MRSFLGRWDRPCVLLVPQNDRDLTGERSPEMPAPETEALRGVSDAREEVHFVTPFIAAYPNPIVVRPGTGPLGTTGRGTTILSWYLRGARRADLYAYPPDGSEKFLGTKTADGWVRSEPIGVGETYKWKIFPRGNKTTPYDEEEVTVITTDDLALRPGAGPLGHPKKFDNVFFPTNLVSRARWYAHEEVSILAGPVGPFTRGLGPESDREPTAEEVLVGYVHVHESEGWFGDKWGQYDTFWRGGVQFDTDAIQRYVARWGMEGATLKFALSDPDKPSCLARVEQAAQDMTDWEQVAPGYLGGDGEHFVDLPPGDVTPRKTFLYQFRSGGVIFVNVGSIAYEWGLYDDLPRAFTLIGADESFPQDDNSTFITHFKQFALELTPSRFM